jgi:hypothetical protein
MGFFTMSTEKQLSAAKVSHAKLNTLLVKAEAGVAAATATAKALAADAADDDKMHAAEADVRACVDLLARRKAALDESAMKIVALERDLAAEVDTALRAQTAKEVEQTTRRIVDASEAMVKAAGVFADYLAKVPYVPESAALLHLTQVCTAEVGPVTATVARLAREYGAAVLRGDASPTLPQPIQPYVPPPVNKPALMQVFTLHAIEWTDTDGMLRQSAKWHDVELPQATAARALRLKLAAPMSDPRRQKLLGQSPGHPERSWLNNLDAETGPDIARSAEASAVEAIKHSAFETPTVGEAKIVKIATPRL